MAEPASVDGLIRGHNWRGNGRKPTLPASMAKAVWGPAHHGGALRHQAPDPRTVNRERAADVPLGAVLVSRF